MKKCRAAIMIAASCVCLAVSPVRAMPAVGAYFDAAGNLSAVSCMPYVPVRIFIVLTDSPVASVDGLRMGYAVIPLGAAPSTVYRLSQSLFGATGTVSGDALAGAYDLIWETPRAAGHTLVLMAWDLMPTSAAEVEIWLTDFANSGDAGLLPEIASAGAWYQVPIHFVCIGSGSGWPSAKMNYNCPIPVEGSVWGGVKALYR